MPMRIHLGFLALLALPAAFACGASGGGASGAQADSGGPSAAAGARQGLPAGAADADARLAASPRHGEWAMVSVDGGADSVRAWVVYPERRDRAPVVIVVHEIFGVSNWIRAVADQLAADGFIAIAPDFLTGYNVPNGPDGQPVRDSATAAVRALNQAQVQRRIDAVARYGMSLPAALPKYGIVGFCWGGSVSFAHAVHAPTLGAAVVYYGTSPASERLASVRAPVLGLYGENDARVNATVPPADSAMRALGKTYEHETYPGAGHGFLRQQDGQNGANLTATQAAWPRTIAFFRQYLRG
jgi:carboxymethylenebutenolidase